MEPSYQRALEAIAEVVRGWPRGGEEPLRRVAAILQQLPRYTGVYLYALEGEVLVLRAHAGRDTEHRRIPVGQGLCGLSARTGQTVLVDDVTTDPRYLACNLETRSEIVEPILAGDRTLAQIDVDSDVAAAFGAADRAFLAEVARVVAPLFG